MRRHPNDQTALPADQEPTEAGDDDDSDMPLAEARQCDDNLADAADDELHDQYCIIHPPYCKNSLVLFTACPAHAVWLPENCARDWKVVRPPGDDPSADPLITSESLDVSGEVDLRTQKQCFLPAYVSNT